MRLSLPKLRLRYADISPNPFQDESFRDELSIISLYRKVMAIRGQPQEEGGGRQLRRQLKTHKELQLIDCTRSYLKLRLALRAI